MPDLPEVKTALVSLWRDVLPRSDVIYGPLGNASSTSNRILVVGEGDTEYVVESDSLGYSTAEQYVLPCVISVDLASSDQQTADRQAFDDYTAARDALLADPSMGPDSAQIAWTRGARGTGFW